MGSRIVATGRALPRTVLTNKDLERYMDTSDDWIKSRTGINQRYAMRQGESLAEIATTASRVALERAGFRVRRLRQSKIPPSFRNVRKRPPLEHLAKGVLDVPNWLVTRLTGRLGDRVAALARRP
jgi:hypothetical protein